jgi:hypothetical protein
MNDLNQLDEGPWYQQTWAWFVLTPLIVVVVASIGFIFLAFGKSDDIVRDNYYQEGRSINQHFSLDETARSLGLDGQLDVDLLVGEVVLDMTSNAPLPPTLKLEMSHPIQSEKDTVLMLTEIAPGRYTAQLDTRLAHRWYVRLSSPAEGDFQAWRLSGELNLDKGTRLVFSEASKADVIGLPKGVEPVEVTAAKAAAAKK